MGGGEESELRALIRRVPRLWFLQVWLPPSVEKLSSCHAAPCAWLSAPPHPACTGESAFCLHEPRGFCVLPRGFSIPCHAFENQPFLKLPSNDPTECAPVQLGLGLINDLILTWGLSLPRALRYILSQERTFRASLQVSVCLWGSLNPNSYVLITNSNLLLENRPPRP